ncbi:MAG: DUF4176 domain-containing protein [Bacilli bacterium]|nr:DUF4176 domain-containing protein [Bacilli bacterium]
MQDKFLPIGSVVLLKGGTKKVMITGYCMKTAENPDKIYDYNGCPFPEGELKSNITSVFDHDQIDKVFFLGFSNVESHAFFDKMKHQLEEYNKKHGL